MQPSHVEEALTAGLFPMSLEEDDRERGWLADDIVKDVAGDIDRQRLHRPARDLVATLLPLELEIVELRFRLCNRVERTQRTSASSSA